MRNYWLRIVLGALAVFAVGMVVVTTARSGVTRVKTVVEGTDPVTIPLVFVPFRVDGRRLGDVDGVVLRRTAPDALGEVEIRVDLDQPSYIGRLQECRRLAVREIERRGGRRGPEVQRWSFTCLSGDSAPENLETFGQVVVNDGGASFPLLVPREVAADLRQAAADSLHPGAPAAPPVPLEVHRVPDSLHDRHRAATESLRHGAPERPPRP